MAQTGAGETIGVDPVYAEPSVAEWPYGIPLIRGLRPAGASMPSKWTTVSRELVRRIGLFLRGKFMRFGELKALLSKRWPFLQPTGQAARESCGSAATDRS